MANSLDISLKDKVVVLSPIYYKGDVKHRLFLCEGGFGCDASTSGRAVFGKFLIDNEKTRISGGEIQRLATDEEVKLLEGG